MKKEFRILSLVMVVIIMSISFFACSPKQAEQEKPTEGTKIGVMTDLHIPSQEMIKRSPSFANIEPRAVQALKYFKDVGVDAILMTGDLVSYGTESEYRAFDSFLTKVYGTPDKAPKLIFVMGNHEYENYVGNQPGATHTSEPLTPVEEVWRYHKKYLDRWSAVTLYNGLSGDAAVGSPFTRVNVNGVQVVSISPDSTSYIMTDNGVAELTKVLDEAVAAANGVPVIAGFHFPMADTHVGVQLFGYSETSGREAIVHGFTKVRDLLKNYPQVVLCSGHTHRSNLSERAIVQDLGFTQVHVGNVQGPWNEQYVTGTGYGTYANVNSSSDNLLNLSGEGAIDRNNTFCNGLLLTFGKDSMDIDRVDLVEGKIFDFAETWTVPYGITAENKDEKFTYVNETRKAAQTSDKLTFAAGSKVTKEIKNGKLKITFPSVEQFHDVEGYKIVISKAEQADRIVYWSSNYVLSPTEKPQYSAFIDDITDATGYSVKVYPIDFYGNSDNLYAPVTE